MYSLRQATQDDEAFLYRLYRATQHEAVAQLWGWDEASEEARFKQRFDPALTQIILVDGRDVGAILIEWRAEALFLANLQILPEEQGHGLGTLILTQMLDLARLEGVPATLEVLKAHPAYKFYERQGFVIEQETATHYRMRATPTAREC